MNRANTFTLTEVTEKEDNQIRIKLVNEYIDLAPMATAEKGFKIVIMPNQILVKTIPPKRGGRWTQVYIKRFVNLKELSFLCGLIRSDGSKGKKCVGFCNTSLELIKGYLLIIKKLGLSQHLGVIITYKPQSDNAVLASKKFEEETGLPISGVYTNKAGVKIAYRVDVYNAAASRFLLTIEKKLRQLFSKTPQFSQYAVHYLRGVAAGDGSLHWKEKPGLYLRISEINGEARREIADIMKVVGMNPFIVQTKNKPPYISTYVTSKNMLMLLNENFFAMSPVNKGKILEAINNNKRFKVLWFIYKAFGLGGFTARRAGEVRGVNYRSFRRVLNHYVKLGWLSVRNIRLNKQIAREYQFTKEGLKVAKVVECASGGFS